MTIQEQTELVSRVLEIFGARLTTIMIGRTHTKYTHDAAAGDLEMSEAEILKLELALETAQRILDLGDTNAVVQAYFMGMHPGLGDRSAALVIADEDIQTARQLLRVMDID